MSEPACTICKSRVICESSSKLSELMIHFQHSNRKGRDRGYSWEGSEKVEEILASVCDYYEVDTDRI